jgi:predicted LPLAT superfamily acyltransferase
MGMSSAGVSQESSSQTKPQHSRQWAESGIGPAWRYRFMEWVIRHGGKARTYHLAYIVTFWYVLFYPAVRRRCRPYLQRRFPDRIRWYQRLWDVYRLVSTYAITLVDVMILNTLGPDVISAGSPNHDQLIKWCEGEKGFVLAHAHVGCFQIGASTLTRFTKKVSLVMIPEPGSKPPATVIDPNSGLEGVLMMTNALLRGEIVGMMGDRSFGSDHNVVQVNFLGSPALFPVTPYRLASATGTSVLVLTAPRVSRTSYELRLAKVIEVPPNLGRNPAEYAPYAQQFADAIGDFAREFPWQVYNFYDVWEQGMGGKFEIRNSNDKSNPKFE